jgi:16S rRNA (cytosine967-C5)-methyltransferase
MSARAVAGSTLDRVIRGGAYSNVVVRTATSDLPVVDGRFVQRLVFGSLRHLLRVDRALAQASTRPLRRIDPIVLSTLRIGAEEILFAGTPHHAAVDGAVRAVREHGVPEASGFVNAVLRSVARSGEPPLPPGDPGTALRHGIAPWLLDQMAATLGMADTTAFLVAVDTEPAIGIRRRGATAVPGEPVAGIAGAYLCDDPAAVAAAVSASQAVVSDPASVAVGLAVAAEPGMVVADVAAAPGIKTMQLWDAMTRRGVLVACDRHERRARNAARRTDPGVHWLIADARSPALRPATFDRVLVDAPCTGLGTLRRRPEIRHRIRPGSAPAMGRRQRAMVEAAIPLLRRGGRLVYSVCTVLAEETIAVVSGLGARAPEGLPGTLLGDGLLLGPHTTGTDGMFISVVDA